MATIIAFQVKYDHFTSTSLAMLRRFASAGMRERTSGTLSNSISVSASPISAPISNKISPHGSTAHERSEEHTSELQSLMRISYAVFCLKKKTKNTQEIKAHTTALI